MAARRTRPDKLHRPRSAAQTAWTEAEVFVFDVEGTLVDAMMPTLRCWRDTLQSSGHDVSLAELHRYAGMDASAMLQKLLAGSTKNKRSELIERQGARFREDYLPHIPPLPGVRPLFEDLKRRERKIALATDCAKDELRRYLEVANVEDLVDAIGCGDDIRRGKPAPRVLEIALRRARVGRRLAVFVGDTPYDAEAARKIAVTSVGVLTGHFSERGLRDAGCQAVFRDLADLHAAIVGAAAAHRGELISAA